MESEPVMSDETKCALCNKETALAIFGIVIGLVFIAMGIDTLRRMRFSERDMENQEVVPND